MWRTTGGAVAITVKAVVLGRVWRIAVACGAGGGLVYLFAAQHGEGLRAFPGQGLPPYGSFAPILQQVSNLAAGKLCCRFGGDAWDGTAGTVGSVGKVVTVGWTAPTITANLGGSVFVRIVTVFNG